MSEAKQKMTPVRIREFLMLEVFLSGGGHRGDVVCQLRNGEYYNGTWIEKEGNDKTD